MRPLRTPPHPVRSGAGRSPDLVRRPRWRVLRAVRLVGLGAFVIGGVMGAAMLGMFVVMLLLSLAVPMALFAGCVALLRHRTQHRRERHPGWRHGWDHGWDHAGLAPAPTPPQASAAQRPERRWRRARERFDALRTDYAAHECDPMAVLRLPALSDVSVASTGRFVEAFAAAQALETENPPPDAHAAEFVAAVERAERAWRAAVDAAERIRLSRLAPAERATVVRVIKLLTTARESDSDAERLAAYARARTELDKLDRAGVVHLPRTARAALEAAARGELPG